MRYLAAITILVLVMVQSVVAQNFKPNYQAGINAFDQKDYVTALAHLWDFAQQGYAEAQHRIGVMYHLGWGETQDYKEAFRWYRLAAIQDNVASQNSLGFMYRDGKGVVQDLVMSYVWFNIAAANGLDTMEYRDKAIAILNVSERKLGQKLSVQCFKKPVSCPEYSFQ